MRTFRLMPIDEWIKLIPSRLIGMNIIASGMDDDEFFMQKDIGWVLRGFAEPLIQKRSIEDSVKELRDKVYTWTCLMKPEQNL
jgi:hypothetical protein